MWWRINKARTEYVTEEEEIKRVVPIIKAIKKELQSDYINRYI